MALQKLKRVEPTKVLRPYVEFRSVVYWAFIAQNFVKVWFGETEFFATNFEREVSSLSDQKLHGFHFLYRFKVGLFYFQRAVDRVNLYFSAEVCLEIFQNLSMIVDGATYACVKD